MSRNFAIGCAVFAAGMAAVQVIRWWSDPAAVGLLPLNVALAVYFALEARKAPR